MWIVRLDFVAALIFGGKFFRIQGLPEKSFRFAILAFVVERFRVIDESLEVLYRGQEKAVAVVNGENEIRLFAKEIKRKLVKKEGKS